MPLKSRRAHGESPADAQKFVIARPRQSLTPALDDGIVSRELNGPTHAHAIVRTNELVPMLPVA